MSLRVWLPLNGDLRNQGLNGNIISSNNYSSNNNGKIGKCIQTNSTSSIPLGVNGNIINNGSISFGGWFKFNKTEISNIVSTGEYTSTYKTATGNILGNDAYGGIALIWNTNDIYTSGTFSTMSVFATLRTSTVNNSTTSISVEFDTWMHLFLIYDKNTNKLSFYKNGVIIGEKSFNTFSDAVSRDIVINYKAVYGGNAISYNIPFYVNDVRIYDHCLSPKEVKEISQGLVLHYPLDNGGWGNENLVTNSKLDGSWTYPSSSYSDKYSPITTIVPSATQYTLSFDAKSTVNGDKMRTHYYSPNTTTTCVSSQGITKTATDGRMDFTLTTQWERYWVIYTQTETTAVKHLICPRLVSGQGTGTVSVKNVKLEEGSVATPWCPNTSDALAKTLGLDSTTVVDCSGFGNDGTTTGTFSWTSDSPRYDVSQVFSESQYIVEPNEINTTDSTIALWVKSPLSANAHVLDARNSNSAGKQPIFQYTNGSIQTGGNNAYVTTSAGLLVANTWVHVALVQSGDSLLVYKNGTLFQTISCTNSPIIKPTVGARLNFANKYTGQLSDLRIYATALSAADVLDLYHTSASIDNGNNFYSFEFMEELTDSIHKNGITSTGTEKTYLVNNFTKTNSTTGWTLGGTVSITNGTISLTGVNPNIQSSNFTVNADDIIVFSGEISLPTPSTSSGGAGLYLGTPTGTATDVYTYTWSTGKWSLTTSGSTNPYFIYSYNLSDVYRFKTYILGSNITLDQIPKPEATSTRDLKALKLTATTTSRIRSGYNTNTSMVINLRNFEIYNINQYGICEVDNTSSIGKGFIQSNEFIEK